MQSFQGSLEQLTVLTRVGVTVAMLYITYIVGLVVYNVYFHPLARFPGPVAWTATPIPFVLYQITGDLPFKYQELHQRYGIVVRVLPNELSFNHPRAWRHIYGARSGKTLLTKDPGAVVSSKDGSYNVLSTPNVADHARYRRVLNPIFSERALRDQEPLIAKHVSRLISQLVAKSSTAPLDLVTWFSLATFDIVADLTFSESLHGVDTGVFHPWARGLSGSTMRFSSLQRAFRNFPHVKFLLDACTPAALIEQRAKHASFVANTVDKRMAMKDRGSDFISHVLPYEASQIPMSPGEIRENFGALLIAGSENVATTLTFTVYNLLRWPRALAKSTAEVRGCFENEGDINFASLPQLRYLAAVMSESMRIQPAAPSSQPRVVPPGGIDILGCHVQGGARVSVPPLCIHRDSHYFKEPEKFIPERWLDDVEPGYCDRAAFEPFGVGPRSCAGRSLAMAEMKMILARILWTFDLALAEPQGDWENGLKIYHLWELRPLYVTLTLARSWGPKRN